MIDDTTDFHPSEDFQHLSSESQGELHDVHSYFGDPQIYIL